jgi:hypothetical protein
MQRMPVQETRPIAQRYMMVIAHCTELTHRTWTQAQKCNYQSLKTMLLTMSTSYTEQLERVAH